MKKVLFALLLLTPALTMAAKPAPNPADYTVAVHVRSSSLSKVASGVSETSLHLVAVIDAKTYELDTISPCQNLLRVGDYKAKIVQEKSRYGRDPQPTPDDTTQAYEYHRVYEFLFPDGKTRKFTVVGEQE
jgi:hypothetical protein